MASASTAAAGPSATTTANTALLFVKPQAVTPATLELVHGTLAARGIAVVAEVARDAADIDKTGAIDAHYGELAKAAMSVAPADLPASDKFRDAFKAQWGLDWDAAPRFNAREAQRVVGCSGPEMEPLWRAGPYVKLFPGTYVAKLEGPGVTQDMYVVNGFYLGMRSLFTDDKAHPTTHCLVVQWEPPSPSSSSSSSSPGAGASETSDFPPLTWAMFRSSVVGATKPTDAAKESLRGQVFASWEALGLDKEPHVGMNGIHGSAGPLEALKERMIWTGATMASDPFGAALLAVDGVDEAMVDRWLNDNPTVSIAGADKPQPIFDATEDMDTADCLALCAALAATAATTGVASGAPTATE